MNMRGTGLVLITLCLLGGLVAAFFTPAIAATLTLPQNTNTHTNQATVSAVAQATSTPGTLEEPTNQPTPLPSGEIILAHDTFQRPNQQFWGTSSDGRTWGSDANTSTAFAIANHTGQITGSKESIVMQATLNAQVDNAELLFSGSVNSFDAYGDSNLGGILRWTDTNNWYKLFIDGSQLELLRDLHGTLQVLATVPFKAIGGTNYSLRFRAQGSYIFGKVWPTAGTEPTSWMLTTIDTTFASGGSGIRVRLAPGAVIHITAFLVTSISANM